MADSEPESQLPPPTATTTNNYKMKKKKRKIRSAEEERDEEQRPSKASRSDRSEKKKEKEKPEEVAAKEREQVGIMEAGPPWRNLQLILSLQNKDIDLPKKVELAFGYVKLRAIEQGDAETEGLETVSVSRVIAFINNWVQSLLISSEKKIRAEGYKPQTEIPGSCLDYRCWEIFKYSLEESLKLQVSLSFSRDFLRVVHCIARDVLSRLKGVSHSKETVLNGMNFDLYGIVIECISLVFSSHGGILNVNLDLWVMTAGTVLELVHKYFNHNLDCCEAGVFFLQFSCVVFEPFAKFLRIHPTRKNGFRDFIDKLLEHLLHLLDVLHLRVRGNDSDWVQNLIKFIEEVFSYGLFHPVHMDGFLSLQSTGKYVASKEGKTRDSKVIIKSYHRHLFDKLEKILAGKNVLALSGVGEMFHLFVNCVKNQTGASARGGLRQLENDFSGLMPKESEDSINVASQKSNGSSSLNAETRKSLFDFFVQIMEPLLQEFNIYLQAELEVGPVLLDVRSILSSTNKILVSFMHEKLYIRTEDTSERAFFNFLKVVYDMVLSFFTKIIQLWPSTIDANNITDLGVLNSVAKELVTVVCYLVEIEYEVAANDLENLWLMMFSVASLCLSLPDVPDQLSLTSEILHLGCQLVNLYSELRQVNNVIVALCKAVRRLALPDCYRETVSPKFTSSEPLLCREAYAKSVSLVLCSKEFRLSIYNAIVSIPEGQVSGCIQQLKTDISESLEWVNVSFLLTAQNEVGNLDPNSSKLYFDLQLELLGRCLADLHALVLDSLTVTAGNSNLIGVSVKDLMTVLRLSMNSLVTIQPDNVDEFLSTVTGRTLSSSGTGCKNDLLSTHWVLLFFFRLYMSCRSIYRQALSFVPPDTSRKMADVMCDSLTAYSGKDWLERTDWTGGGYFSWILQPSASLFTIIQSVSDIYLKDKVADCAPLVFVLNTMAVQRLVDLNRLIKSFEYLLQRKDYLVQTKLMNDGGWSSPDRKNRKKLKKCILKLRQEAADLTNFMMEHLPLLTKDHMSISSFDDATYKSCDAQWLCEYDRWDFGIGALNEKSLPSSLWWIICQSIDVWCTHAAKKKLKMFLSLLIQNSLLHVEGSLDEFAKQKNNEPGHLKNVTARKISLELLRDTVLYEQKFVRRLMASRFCRILEKSVLAIFPNVGEENLKSSPNTPEFLSVFGNSSMVGSRDNHILNDCTSVADPISCSSKRLTMKCFKEQKSCLSHSISFTDCQTLLNFLCWMPKGSSNCKSFSLYAIYILNVERLVVGSLLDCHCALYTQNLYELFRLLLSCRRVLKSLIMASCEENMGTRQSSLTLMLSQSSFPVLWLLKSLSAVIMPQHAVSENTATPEKDMTFSLMDHTSHLFLILSKYQFIHAVHFLTSTKKSSEEQNNCAVGHGGHNLDDPDPSLDSPRGIDAWKTVVLIAETLKEQMMMLLVSQKEGLCDAKVRVPLSVIELLNLSSITSCSQGFMWGLASALEHLDLKNSEFKTKLSRWKPELMDKLIRCIDVFAEFVNYFARALLVEDDQLPGNFFGGHYLPMPESCDNNMGVEESFLDEKEQQNCGPVRKCSASLENKDQSDKIAWKKRFHSVSPDCGDNILTQCDAFDLHCLKKLLLKGFISGENPEAAFFLRQLFIASSALLRLNLQIKRASLSIRSVPIFVGISQVLLVELANKVEVSSPSSFVWLDGVIKFLEELGSCFPLTDPTLSNNLYVKMVELHFLAIGKCIVLQGKRASLAPHDTESSTKTLDGHGLSESAPSYGPYCLDEFKAMLRTSFKVFVRKPSELHLLSAIQLLERALVGVRKGCTVNYEMCTGGSDGGRVSSIVAAGIDCMDLVLEFVTGRKRSSVVKRRIPSLVACLFNIILHLQGPSIFYANIITGKGNADPDPGSVILMCVEVLTKVFGKHPMYQLDTCQVGQSLRIPAALFQNIFQLRISEDPAAHNSSRFLDDQDTEIVGGMNSCVVDRQFLIDLFSACCRLMSTALKHYKSETEHCIALLEDSVSVLLHCLEMVDPAAVVRKCYFTWEVREAVKCASFLRRIYEEMRQQKDVFGRHCSLFLSDYIWTYSGYGPLKTGIRREIDEALRPGVYALIDACSADDLQRLHTAFGEGPCRSTLASLQHDYKLNFQYGGKV